MTRTAHSLSAGAAPPRIQATNIHIALHVDEKVSSIWYLNPQAFGKLSACVTSCDVIVKKFLEQRKDNNGLLACLRREVLSARLYSVSKPAELIFDVLEHMFGVYVGKNVIINQKLLHTAGQMAQSEVKLPNTFCFLFL